MRGGAATVVPMLVHPVEVRVAVRTGAIDWLAGASPASAEASDQRGAGWAAGSSHGGGATPPRVVAPDVVVDGDAAVTNGLVTCCSRVPTVPSVRSVATRTLLPVS